MNDVSIFWDNSNIFISAQQVAKEKEGASAPHEIRIQFENLLRLAAADRVIDFAIAVGSIPPEVRDVWKKLEGSGIDVRLFERGEQTGKEQAMDEALQIHMLRKTLDCEDPGIAVLMTGDGSGYFAGEGFHADLERMHKNGWGIEVIAWETSCNSRLKWWSMKNGIFIPLEDYYESITFRERDRKVVRSSASLSLNARPKARARSLSEFRHQVSSQSTTK